MRPFDHSDICLATGSAGELLASCVEYPSRREHIEKLVDEFGGALEVSDLRCGLFDGLTGVAWVLEKYVGPLGLADTEAVTHNIRSLALQEVGATRSADIISGVAGIGLYSCLVNDAHELASAALDRLVTDRGIYEKLSTNLGIAHGIPGLLIAISSIIDKYPQLGTNSVMEFVVDVHSTLEQLAKPSERDGCGYVVGDGKVARIAWCYGDLSVAAGLNASHSLVPRRCKADAIRRLCERVLARPIATWQMTDYGLCHGISGVHLLLSSLAHFISSSDASALLRDQMIGALSSDSSSEPSTYLYDRNYGENSLLGGRPGMALWQHQFSPAPDNRWHSLFLGGQSQ
ncbi:TPA: lanthionine synthetase LanC family protein [Stenotrophomonas maltophilia]